MKALVLLTLFSVCNANILWHEQPKTNLDMVKDAFWDYVAKATRISEDSLSQIKQSELGNELNTMIAQSADTVNQYIISLKAQVDPVTQDFITKLTQKVEVLNAHLEQDLQPHAEEMVASFQRNMEELKREATSFAKSMDPESLKQTLTQRTEELKAQMEPYTTEVKEKVEQTMREFESNVIPLARDFETQMTQKIQEIQQSMAPLAEELKAKLDANTQDMQAQLIALWESFARPQ